MQQEQYKYFAFISYSSQDIAWGKRLQKKLEGYRMPATLCSEHGWKRKPLNPVFFAPTDIQPGGLTVELQEHLRASKHLIVICSPHSAQSTWVGKEIEYFYSLGRSEHIHFFIVDGKPHSSDIKTECFNPIIEQLGLPEILGANVHENIYALPWLNRERAYVQLITKLLGVEFDSIWQRHKRLLLHRVALGIIALLVVLCSLVGIWQMSRPIDVQIQLMEQSVTNDNLPTLQDAVISLSLDNEIKTDTIQALTNTALFRNVPQHYLDKEVGVTSVAKDFLPIDTTMILQQTMNLPIHRDTTIYGNIHLRVWSITHEQTIPYLDLMIDGRKVQSNANGYVTLQIPLAEQKMNYDVLINNTFHSSISMPCGDSDVILVE